MQKTEIVIGEAVYDVDRIYAETGALAELIRARVEAEAAAIDREGPRAV